jgi:hypothetical protein
MRKHHILQELISKIEYESKDQTSRLGCGDIWCDHAVDAIYEFFAHATLYKCIVK